MAFRLIFFSLSKGTVGKVNPVASVRKLNERWLLGDVALLTRTQDRAQLNNLKINDHTWVWGFFFYIRIGNARELSFDTIVSE